MTECPAPPPPPASPSLDPVLPAPALPEPSLQPPAPESGTRPAPSYLGSDWTSPRFPAPVPRRLLTPSAVMPARHLPWLCCQRNWPGLAPLWALEGGALTGEGRANQVRQMKSAGRGGGRGQGERRVASRDTWAQHGGGEGAGLWDHRGAAPHRQLWRKEGWKGCFPGLSLCRQRDEHQAPWD